MKYDADPCREPSIHTSKDLFTAIDRDSPLLTASLIAGEPVFRYTHTVKEELRLADAAVRCRWSSRKPETEDDRVARIEAQRQKTEETHKRVDEALEALSRSLSEGKSGQLREFLGAMSRFHRYSWGNTILIVFQRPDATNVAGFTTWKDMGRYVKAGETGIAILAPIPKRMRVEVDGEQRSEHNEDEPTTKVVNGNGVWGFKVVHVFDVSQTDGQPLAEFASVKGDPAHYLDLLKEQVKADGILLDYRENLGGSFGRSFGGKIEIKSGMTPAHEFSTLVHEFAHELLHPKTVRSEIPITVKETEAEAVTYVVDRAVGLETGTAASDYIQLYQGDAATLAASLDRIQKTSSHILSRLEQPSVGSYCDAA